MKITTHISFAEATKSQTATRHGINNVPGSEQIGNMKHLAEQVFEPVRKHFGKPIAITSFYRSPELNIKIGGSKTSQHCKGEAMDIDADVFGGMTNAQIFEYIKKNLTFDQLIWEFGANDNPAWVHVSLKKNGNRRQVLRALRIGGKTRYEPIL